MRTIYHGFLPQQTASTHRVFAIVDHGGGETVEALATSPLRRELTGSRIC